MLQTEASVNLSAQGRSVAARRTSSMREGALNPPRQARFILPCKFMFPNTKHTPAASSENTSDFEVALRVPREFGLPKRDARFWNSTVAQTAVPKAAINEHGDLRGVEYKIRLSRHPRSAPPARDAMHAKQGDEPQFRRAVSARTNAGHPLGTFRCSKCIHHDYFFGGYFLKCSSMSARISSTVFLLGVFPAAVAHARPT